MTAIKPQVIEHKPPFWSRPRLFIGACVVVVAGIGGAIYTQSGHMFHILRKVLLRVSTKFDWFILKLH